MGRYVRTVLNNEPPLSFRGIPIHHDAAQIHQLDSNHLKKNIVKLRFRLRCH